MQAKTLLSIVSVSGSSQPMMMALISLAMVWLTGCAGSPVGNSLQQSLEADPQLAEQDTILGSNSNRAEDEEPQLGVDSADSEVDNPIEQNEASSRATLPPGERSRSNPSSTRNDEDGVSTSGSGSDAQSTSASRPRPSDLTDVPADLRLYIEDLLALQLFSKAEAQQGKTTDSSVAFAPNQTITRGQYANWLLTANNLFYRDQPGKKIRVASSATTPAFQDVPVSHPYFGAIQGLAEAGLIPSALTGNSTAVNFRPDAPLTRESLILWKVPLDIRTTLPTASVEAVQATWGFQDAASIEPLALRAVLADHQTGDFANVLRAFGYTTLFQPQKAVTQAEAAATLWRFGTQTEGVTAADLLTQEEGNSVSPRED
jgi:hypothetical protein